MQKYDLFTMRKEGKSALVKTGIVVAIVLIIKLLSLSPSLVEHWYATGWYPMSAFIQRIITGWFPFSLGDLLYTAGVLYLVVALVKLVRGWFRNGFSGKRFLLWLLSCFRTLLWIYVVFMVCWGLNYSRKGIAWQMGINTGAYTTTELADLSVALREKLNNARRELGDSVVYSSFDSLRVQSARAYRLAALKHPFLQYRQPSVKASLYSEMLTYAGYTGYYNPFSGEAQVNVKVPPFYLPFVFCHEMAHQVGYGDESEANFVSYLVTTSSDQPVFRYSAYYDLFNYANSELFMRDSALAKANYRALDTLVKQDLRTARLFFKRYQNRIEPVLKFMYGQYLKANNQPQGIDTYEAVTAWLIAYGKKKGI